MPVVEEIIDPKEVQKAPEDWRLIGAEVSEQLDSPLTCRAFFIGVAYLSRAIACESALLRGTIEAVPEEGLEIVPAYSALCVGYIEALRAVAALSDEHEEMLKKFNQSLS